MTTMVRDLPMEERPREKLLAMGAGCLSDAELLAILLRTGTAKESVLSISEKVLARFKETGLTGLVHLAPSDITDIHGISAAKAATIIAAVELGHRLSVRSASKIEVVHGPEDAAHYAMPRFRFEQREHFAVMLLNTKNHILGISDVSIGSLSASVVHPREVFRAAIRFAAASMILFHNHPSGDSAPSREDMKVTERIKQAGKVFGIDLLDHVIIGNGEYTSIREEGLL